MRVSRAVVQALTGDGDRWHDAIDDACTRWNIDTKARLAAFLAQCGHESAGFKKLREDMRYSANRLLEIWPGRFTAADALIMQYDERAIAERAYGGRLGNRLEGSGDGWDYRAGGLIGITGRDGFRRAGRLITVDLEANPELIEAETYAALTAAAYWKTNGLNELADSGKFDQITRTINKVMAGKVDRLAWWAKTRLALA